MSTSVFAAPAANVTRPATEVAAAARTYATLGWKVFPLWWVEGPPPLPPAVTPATHPMVCACPLGTACGSPGKHPIGRLGDDGPWLAPHGVRDASSHPRDIERWWRFAPHANIGLPAHDNGLAIIDVDPRHWGHRSLLCLQAALIDHADWANRWPGAVVQATGGGGEHHLFAAPTGGIPSTKRAFGPALPGLDTRGRGGYVVAAPSVHASGGRYDWLPATWKGAGGRRHLFDDLPPWPRALSLLIERAAGLVDRASVRAALDVFTPWRRQRSDPDVRTVKLVESWMPAAAEGSNASLAIQRYVAISVAGELDALRKTAEGGRNDQLNRAGFAIGRFIPAGLLDEQAAFGALVAAGRKAGLLEVEIPKTVLSGLVAGKARPWIPPTVRASFTHDPATPPAVGQT